MGIPGWLAQGIPPFRQLPLDTHKKVCKTPYQGPQSKPDLLCEDKRNRTRGQEKQEHAHRWMWEEAEAEDQYRLWAPQQDANKWQSTGSFRAQSEQPSLVQMGKLSLREETEATGIDSSGGGARMLVFPSSPDPQIPRNQAM